MTDNTIIINVCGTAEDEERAAIAFLIADFLSHTGFDVDINFASGLDEAQVMDRFEEKLESLADSAKIVVNEGFPFIQPIN